MGDPEGKETRSAKKCNASLGIFSSLVSSSPSPADELKLIYLYLW
jgi:hypothetical protein